MTRARISLFIAIVALSQQLYAQTTGSISGVVTDPSGAVVAGATVTVTNEGINAARTVNTNSSGFYSLSRTWYQARIP